MSTLQKDTTLKGILCAASGFGLFAAADSIAKYLTEYYSVYNIVLYNGIFLVLTLIVASMFIGGLKQTMRSRYLKLHFLRGLLIFFQVCLIIYAFNTLPMTTVYAIIFISPILLSLLSILILKDTVDGKHWLVIFTGFAGVIVVFRPGFEPISLPLIAVLASALFFSLSSLIVRFIPKDEENILAWGILPEIPIILCSLIACLFTELTLPQTEHLLPFIAGGALSAIAMISLSLGFVYAKISVAAPFHYTQIIWGTLLGYFIFGDIPDIWTLAGAAIIIASGIWLIRHENGKRKAVLLQAAMEQAPGHPGHVQIKE